MNKFRGRISVYIVVLSLIVSGLSSCFSITGDPIRLYLKKIQTNDIVIEWFFYSLISNTTPDYITTQFEDKIDTLFISNNIRDLYLKGDTICVEFYGKPSFQGQSIHVPNRTFNYFIRIDTLGKDKDVRRRYSFKE